MSERVVITTETSDCYHANEGCPKFQSGRRIGATGEEHPVLELTIEQAAESRRACRHCIP